MSRSSIARIGWPEGKPSADTFSRHATTGSSSVTGETTRHEPLFSATRYQSVTPSSFATATAEPVTATSFPANAAFFCAHARAACFACEDVTGVAPAIIASAATNMHKMLFFMSISVCLQHGTVAEVYTSPSKSVHSIHDLEEE